MPYIRITTYVHSGNVRDVGVSELRRDSICISLPQANHHANERDVQLFLSKAGAVAIRDGLNKLLPTEETVADCQPDCGCPKCDLHFGDYEPINETRADCEA